MPKLNTSREICENIQDLVGQCERWDGSSGEEEKIYMMDLQCLLNSLSEYPTDLHLLDPKTKKAAETLVSDYLSRSFNGYW
jgi:hypothetical protein